MRNQRAMFAAIVVTAIVLTGCDGGDDAAGETSDEETAEITAETDEGTAEDTAESTGADSTAEDAPTDGSAPTDDQTDAQNGDPTDEQSGEQTDAENSSESGDDGSSGEQFTGDPDSEWCVASRELDELSDDLDDESLFADPARLEAAYTSIVDRVDAARPLAPPEIADDVETTYRGYSLLVDAFDVADWVFLDTDLSIIDELDAEMTVASDRIGAYNEQVCGIADDSDDRDDRDDADDAEADGGDDDEFDPSAGTPREQIAASLVELGFTEQEASCIAENVDVAAYLESANTDVILDAFDICEIPVSRLVELGGG